MRSVAERFLVQEAAELEKARARRAARMRAQEESLHAMKEVPLPPPPPYCCPYPCPYCTLPLLTTANGGGTTALSNPDPSETPLRQHARTLPPAAASPLETLQPPHLALL